MQAPKRSPLESQATDPTIGDELSDYDLESVVGGLPRVRLELLADWRDELPVDPEAP
jgi:hypothetical protein